MHRLLLPALLVASTLLACATERAPSGGSRTTAPDPAALRDTLSALVEAAYDVRRHDDPVAGLMSLYPAEGTVISAANGVITTDRAALESSVRMFWQRIGVFMQDPDWEWIERHIDVLGRDAAAMTFSYRIPHRTSAGEPHVIGGVWTAVFARRDGRWVIVQEHLSDMTEAQLAPSTPGGGSENQDD